MRVSLQIDGDASGAVKAAQDTSSAIDDLSKKAGSAAGNLNSAGKAGADAANDNVAAGFANVAQKVADLAGKAGAAQGSLAKLASGAASVAEGVGSISRAAGALPALSGVIGLAATAVALFYDTINKGTKSAEDQLGDQAKLIGMIKDAYVKAKSAAGDFYEYGASATKLLLLQNEAALKQSLKAQVGQYISSATTFDNIGDFVNRTKTIKPELQPFEDALFKLNDGFKNGAPDVKAYVDEIARIALLNPDLQKVAVEQIEALKKALATASGISNAGAAVNVVSGTAKPKDLAQLGITPDEKAATFDRFTKSLERQAAAQEAEANAAGKSAGEAARLRAEFTLTEAAQQAGIKVAGDYADKIDTIAKRYGEAAQKAAVAKLQSDAFFDRAQLGRSSDDANVARQLRTAFGDNADLNSGIANIIRANNEMRELKSTAQDLASGAFSDLRQQIQTLGFSWQAMGNVALNTLNKIVDKLASKALDAGISRIVGLLGGGGPSLNSDGSIAGAVGPTSVGGAPLVGFDVGGWTGSGPKHKVAGFVHKEEFVFDQDATRRIGVSNLERLRSGGLPGYAGGGFVGGGGPSSWGDSNAVSGGLLSQLQQALRIEVVTSMDDDGKLQTIVRRVAKSSADQAVSAFADSEDFIRRSSAAATTARARGW